MEHENRLGSKRQSFLHGAVIIMFGTFMAKFIGIFFRLLLGNIIGAEGNGYYSTAYSIYQPLYAMSISGLPVALAKIVAESTEKKEYTYTKRTFKVAHWLFMLVGVVLMLVMLIFNKELSAYMHNPGARFAIAALAPVAFFCCLSGVYKGYYEGLRNMYPTAVSEIVEALSKLLFGAVFMYFGIKLGANEYLKNKMVFGLPVASINEAKCMLGAAGAVCGIAISSVIGTLFLAMCYHTKGPKNKLKREEINTKVDREILNKLLAIAVPICLSSIVFNISGNIDARTAKIGLEHAVNQNPNFFAQMLNSTGRKIEDIPNFLWGGYGLTLPIYNFLPAMMVSFGVSLLPNLAAAYSTGNQTEVKKHIESSLRITNTLVFIVGGVVFSNAKSILMLIYSKRAADIALFVPCLRILGLCLIFSSITSSTNIILQAIGKVRIPFFLMTCGVFIKYNVNKILVKIPHINIKGAPIGTLCCYTFIALVGCTLVFKFTGIKIDKNSVFLKPLLGGGSTAIFGLIAEFIGNHLITIQNAWQNMFKSFITLGCTGLFCLWSLSFFKVLKEEDIEMLPKGDRIILILKKLRMLA